MKIACSGCKTLLITIRSTVDLTVDHPRVGMSITVQALCPRCDTIMSFDVINKIQKQQEEHGKMLTYIERIEGKLDAVLKAIPKCNCAEMRTFDQCLQADAWRCPIHGEISISNWLKKRKDAGGAP